MLLITTCVPAQPVSCKHRRARDKKDDGSEGVKCETVQEQPLAVKAMKAAASTPYQVAIPNLGIVYKKSPVRQKEGKKSSCAY
jgi:hypothetical protein